MSKTSYVDYVVPCQARHMLKGTGGPAGMELQPLLHGVRCDYCNDKLPSGYLAGSIGQVRVKVCAKKKCRFAYNRKELPKVQE